MTTTVRLNVHSPFSPPSQGRLYSKDSVLVPFFSALKVHTSLPGAPTSPLASGATNSWPVCCTTVWSLICADSDHLKPVVALEHSVTVNVSPAATFTSWLMSCCFPKSSQETSIYVPVDGAQDASHNDMVSKANDAIILSFTLFYLLLLFSLLTLCYIITQIVSLCLVTGHRPVSSFSLLDYKPSQARIE